MNIRSITIYSDDQGRILEMHQPIPADGEVFPSQPAMFFAAVNGQINTPNGPINIPLKILIEAAGVREAFEKYKTTCDAKAPQIMAQHVERMKQQAVRRSLTGGG